MKLITTHDLAQLKERAARGTRRRANLNLHPQLDEPVQRFLNAVERGSYVCPRRHSGVGRWELFVAIKGSIAVLTFTAAGRVLERAELNASGPVYAVEIPPGVWHALVALACGTILLEVKPGPSTALDDKDFAAGTPGESPPMAPAMVRWYESAGPGDEPPLVGPSRGGALTDSTDGRRDLS